MKLREKNIEINIKHPHMLLKTTQVSPALLAHKFPEAYAKEYSGAHIGVLYTRLNTAPADNLKFR